MLDARTSLFACVLLLVAPGCASLNKGPPPSADNAAPASSGAASGSPSETAEKKTPISGNRLARSIYIGQVYASGAVYLDVSDDKEEGKKRWSRSIKIYPLQAESGFKDAPFSGTLIGPLEQVYPPEAETISEKSARCSAGTYHADPSLSYADGTLKDYFDRGAVDNCHGYNVAKYWTSEKITRSFPVFAVSEFDIADVDYSVRGTSRPLTTAEKREVSQYHFTDDPDQDTSQAHFLEAATEMVAFRFPAEGLQARISTFVSERGEHRTRSYVLDVMDSRKRIKKRHMRTLFKGNG